MASGSTKRLIKQRAGRGSAQSEQASKEEWGWVTVNGHVLPPTVLIMVVARPAGTIKFNRIGSKHYSEKGDNEGKNSQVIGCLLSSEAGKNQHYST